MIDQIQFIQIPACNLKALIRWCKCGARLWRRTGECKVCARVRSKKDAIKKQKAA